MNNQKTSTNNKAKNTRHGPLRKKVQIKIPMTSGSCNSHAAAIAKSSAIAKL